MEKVWIGNLVRANSNSPRYMYHNSEHIIYFRTMKKIEIAFFDKRSCTLYLNRDYRMNFKAIKNQIMHDYKPKIVTEYFNME